MGRVEFFFTFACIHMGIFIYTCIVKPFNTIQMSKFSELSICIGGVNQHLQRNLDGDDWSWEIVNVTPASGELVVSSMNPNAFEDVNVNEILRMNEAVYLMGQSVKVGANVVETFDWGFDGFGRWKISFIIEWHM